jgi:hypothetical protein
MESLIGILLDIGLGAIALRLATDLRKLVHIHEGRITRLEKHTGLVIA